MKSIDLNIENAARKWDVPKKYIRNAAYRKFGIESQWDTESITVTISQYRELRGMFKINKANTALVFYTYGLDRTRLYKNIITFGTVGYSWWCWEFINGCLEKMLIAQINKSEIERVSIWRDPNGSTVIILNEHNELEALTKLPTSAWR